MSVFFLMVALRPWQLGKYDYRKCSRSFKNGRDYWIIKRSEEAFSASPASLDEQASREPFGKS